MLDCGSLLELAAQTQAPGSTRVQGMHVPALNSPREGVYNEQSNDVTLTAHYKNLPIPRNTTQIRSAQSFANHFVNAEAYSY